MPTIEATDPKAKGITQDFAGSALAPNTQPGGAPPIDPFLKYSTANALFQEIAFLNNYLKDFPYVSGYNPYLVRMQLSVLPKRRNLSYDVFSDISFFASNDWLGGSRNTSSTDIRAAPIVPILASENLERSSDRLQREALLAASGSGAGVLFGNAAIGATTETAARNAILALANDLNGLFTMGRVTENVLRARFGALFAAGDFFEMIPRTHNVSLLVLVPPGYSTLDIVAEQSMRDAMTGELLPRGDGTRAFMEKLAEIMGEYRLVDSGAPADPLFQRGGLCHLNHNPDAEALSWLNRDVRRIVDFARKRLRNDVAVGDFDRFKQRFQHCIYKIDSAGELAGLNVAADREFQHVAKDVWVALSTLQADLPSAFVSVSLPNFSNGTPASPGGKWIRTSGAGSS